MTALVDRIRALPRDERLAFYRSLPAGALARVRHLPGFLGRDEQLGWSLDDLHTVEIVRGGRRVGKTQTASWMVNAAVLSGRWTRPRIIAAENDAIRDTVIFGPSGLYTSLPPHLRKRAGYVGGTQGKPGIYTFPNGAAAICISALNPGKAIGQGCDITLADDPAGWITSCGETRAAETFKQARVSNSEGPRPCMVVPTTRRGVSFLRAALTPGQMAGARIHRLGGTVTNTALSPAYIRDTIAGLRDEAGDWAAEELDDEDRDEAPGALWKRAWIDARRVAQAPELERVVVAVDPADDDKKDSDEVGVVVLGLDFDGRVYVLADYTARHPTEIWPAVVAWAFRAHRADAVVVETNRGAGLVRRLLRIEAPNVPIREVQASRGKATRAEPGAALYQDGRVSHVIGAPQLTTPAEVPARLSVFDPQTTTRRERDVIFRRDPRRWRTLEDELCGWVPRSGARSPNGIDALTWGLADLCPFGGDTWAATPAVEPAPTADPYRYQPVPASGDGWSAGDPFAGQAFGADPFRY